jgi:hypothetical protein
MNAKLLDILAHHSHEWSRDHVDEEWERLYAESNPRPAGSVPYSPRYDV